MLVSQIKRTRGRTSSWFLPQAAPEQNQRQGPLTWVRQNDNIALRKHSALNVAILSIILVLTIYERTR
jgi:hypothetical protein